MARSRTTSTTSTDGANKTITGNLIHTTPPSHFGLRHRISTGVLGVKGSLLSPSQSSTNLRLLAKQGEEFKQENPVARLKLLLVRIYDCAACGWL